MALVAALVPAAAVLRVWVLVLQFPLWGGLQIETSMQKSAFLRQALRSLATIRPHQAQNKNQSGESLPNFSGIILSISIISIYPFLSLSNSFYTSACLSVYLLIYFHVFFFLSIYLAIFLSSYLSSYLSFSYLSTFPSIRLNKRQFVWCLVYVQVHIQSISPQGSWV